jgi:hypothetical protein
MYQHELTVATLSQKVLFFCEMEGQLSDGNWENARPSNHWEEWMLSWNQIKVSGSAEVVGTNWQPLKFNYNFADKALLEAVGDRCLTYGSLARQVPDKVERLLSLSTYEARHAIPTGLREYDDWTDRAYGKPEHYSAKYLSMLAAAGFTREDFHNAGYFTHYTMKDLVSDCKALKVAVRNQLGVNPKEVKAWQDAVDAALTPHFEYIGKNKYGEIIVKRGYFYTFGMTSTKMRVKVEELLAAAGIPAVVDAEDQWRAWPGSSYFVATVRRQ